MSLFFRRGQSAAFWVPSIASTTAGPTAAEVTAGTDLSQAITAMVGFTTTLNRINTPVMSQKEETQTDGPQTLGDATITLLDDDGVSSSGSTARVAAHTALAEAAAGYVVVSPQKVGPLVATDKVWVFPAKVGAVNPDLSTDAKLATTEVQIAITASPRKNVAVS